MESSTTTLLKWDTDQAVQFLESFNPPGPWHLSAIIPDKKGVFTRTFAGHEKQEMRDWIEAQQNNENVYFHVNGFKSGIINKRAANEDIGCVVALHVDIDVAPGFDPDEELPKILAALQSFDPPPTAIIFSGGGYQGFWSLKVFRLPASKHRAIPLKLLNAAAQIDCGQVPLPWVNAQERD
jgi:hypothetical protein